MDRNELKRLLQAFRKGEIDEVELLSVLESLPYEDLGFAAVDHHRHLRRGFPEVIFAEFKTAEQTLAIAEAVIKRSGKVLITRVSQEVGQQLMSRFADGDYDPESRTFAYPWKRLSDPDENSGLVCVVTAGTSDIPVAREASRTARLMGCRVEEVFDVGVAGVHRLVGKLEVLRQADAIVAVAGMEGALPSVIAGLVAVPVVAVPTSVGYGASFGGVSALLSMLNSCASGVAVVNIDNGFGAGFFAALVACRTRRNEP